MSTTDLAAILQRTRAEKLEYLERLSSSDAHAIELLIDDCLTHRWPQHYLEWIALADRRRLH